MNLRTAQHYARHIEAWLSPVCHRIAVAGSVRRECDVCNDIDLVVIPKVTEEKDLLGETAGQISAVWSLLAQYVEKSNGAAKWLSGHGQPNGRNLLVQLPKCQLDVFQATPETWGTMLLCRTGSKDHNIWLASRAKARGGHWNPYRYLDLNGRHHDVSTEEAIYAALGLHYIDPKKRQSPFPQL